MNSLKAVSISFLSSLLLLACAGTKSATKDGASGDPNALGENQPPQEKVTEYDLNHDQKPDVWAYTLSVRGEDGRQFDRLARKELDINWDGKIDISRIYNEQEQIEQESLDLDFDGRIDQVNFYEKSVIVRKERDLDPTQGPDVWLYYEKGKLVRKERDTDSDGKIDYWEYWEGDQVDRVGEDLDRDGQVDKWTKNPTSEG